MFLIYESFGQLTKRFIISELNKCGPAILFPFKEENKVKRISRRTKKGREVDEGPIREQFREPQTFLLVVALILRLQHVHPLRPVIQLFLTVIIIIFVHVLFLLHVRDAKPAAAQAADIADGE